MYLCFIFSGLIVVLDQFIKRWISRTVALGEIGPEIIPGILGLTHWENDGAMLNFLSGQQWLLACIPFVASVVLIMILLRYNEGFWGTLGLSAVLGGTVGNLMDRIFNDGKVIDMFRTLFINFPIFNIADIFITLGFITFLVHFIVLTFKSEEGEAPAEHTPADESIASELSDIQSFYAEQTESGSADFSDFAEPAPAPAVDEYTSAPVTPYTDNYQDIAFDSVTDTTPDMSFTMESLEAELGSLDADYDIDDLLREYGIEDDDINL